jgi:hypothetical protein
MKYQTDPNILDCLGTSAENIPAEGRELLSFQLEDIRPNAVCRALYHRINDHLRINPIPNNPSINIDPREFSVKHRHRDSMTTSRTSSPVFPHPRCRHLMSSPSRVWPPALCINPVGWGRSVLSQFELHRNRRGPAARICSGPCLDGWKIEIRR